MKGSLMAGPTILPLFNQYLTVTGSACQHWVVVISKRTWHTLVICNENRQDCEGDGQQVRIADIDGILQIWQVATPDTSGRRGEAAVLCVHDLNYWIGVKEGRHGRCIQENLELRVNASALSAPEVSDRLMPGRMGMLHYLRYTILTEPLPTAMTFVV